MRNSLNKKRQIIKDLNNQELNKNIYMDECYAIKKQGLEIVDQQKQYNEVLNENLYLLERELYYLQVKG